MQTFDSLYFECLKMGGEKKAISPWALLEMILVDKLIGCSWQFAELEIQVRLLK